MPLPLDNPDFKAILASLSGHPDANATTNTPTSEAEGQPEAAAPKLLAGKYKDEKELERGYLHQFTETQKIIEERDKLRERLDILTPLVGNAEGADRVSPAARAAERKSAVAELADTMSVDPNQLVAAFSEIAQQVFAPITSGIQARQIVEQENPDFAKFEGEVTQFLKAHPEINKRVAATIKAAPGDPLVAAQAMDYAFLKFAQSRAATQTQEPERKDASGAAQVEARLDAAITSSAGGRADANASTETAAIQAAFERGEQSGDWAPFLALRLKGVIPDSHYGIGA